MLTIFTVPLPFVGNDELVQYNAITSWTLLNPRPEILLLGDEIGVADFAQTNNLCHIPALERNELGDLSIRSMFELAIRNASHDLLALVDADNILMSDFMPAVQRAVDTVPRFMLNGRRRAIRLTTKIDFVPGWENYLRTLVTTKGHQFRGKGGAGSDYAVFRHDLFTITDIPDFSLGKGHWDGWRMWYALQHGYELVECTEQIFAVHQDHPWRNWRQGPGHERNWKLAQDKMAWVTNATRQL